MAEVSVVEARTLLARAFVDDPLMVWFYPDDDARPHACAAMFGLFAEQYLEWGRVDVLRRPDPVAVAMWRWPGGSEDDAPPSEQLPSNDGLMAALMGTDRAAQVGSALSVLAELKPTQPYAYLHLLAVHPDSRGAGLGGELLDQGLDAARSAGLVACLDTMNPTNVPFYEAHGLAVRHERRLANGGPTVWSMATG